VGRAQDPHCHKKFLKPSPAASPLVNRCIECGFCESNCPSRDTTLTPRQRITTYREISRLKALPNRSAEEDKRCVGLCLSGTSQRQHVIAPTASRYALLLVAGVPTRLLGQSCRGTVKAWRPLLVKPKWW
jgi:hypothetical protein